MSSLNVQGLGNECKRRKLFRYFKDLNRDIIFLQETHCTPQMENIWSNEWGRKIWFANGTSSTRGVAVLIKKNFPIEVKKCSCLFEGRVIMLEIIVDEQSYLITNVYGPNEDDAEFYIKLFEEINNKEEPNFIIVGDLNVTLSFDKDTRGLSTDSHKRKREIINNFIDVQNVSDIWRERNPEKYQFSWKRNENKKQTSRLDYFLVSAGLNARVNKTEINPGFNSDHLRIDLDINLAKHKRGKGFWKFNSSLLMDKDFVRQMNILLDQYAWSVKPNISPAKEWEILKLEITTMALEFGMNRAKAKGNLIKLLESKISKLDEKLKNETDENKQALIKRDIKRTETFLDDEYDDKARQSKYRCKSRWYNEAEKNTKYFFNLERANYNAKTIHTLKREDGSTIKEAKDILKEEFIFYKKLYLDTNKKEQRFDYTNNTKNKLTEIMSKELEEPITLSEMSKALQEMENDKTPGCDGLNAAFYKFFWGKLKWTLFKALTYALDIGFLHQSARRGIISLIPKKEKDLLWLTNWRPLTLLNLDYKILSKLLARRMKSKLPYIIEEDQSGFMQNRSISHNLRKILDIICFSSNKKLETIMISIDWDKCFDRLSFESINCALEYFNFGPKFRSYVQTLLCGTHSCVINNGFISDWFYPERGAKQGCCISPFLSICVLEVFSNAIRQNKNIKGIKIGELEYKLIQFADDMNLPLQFDRETLEQLCTELEHFERATGSKVNYNKTSIYRMGSLQNSNAKLYTSKPFKWTNDLISVLGVVIGNDIMEVRRHNLYPILDKAEKICKLWKNRSLSLMGKVTVVNTMISSLFVYKLSVLDILSEGRYKQIEDGIKKFIWGGKRAKIQMSTLYNVKELGGLKLVDIRTKDMALKAQWVSAYKYSLPIRNLADQFLPPLGHDWWYCNLNKKDLNTIMPQPSFWKSVSRSWFDVHRLQNKPSKKEIENQFIWFNSKIRINHKPIFIRRAWLSGLRFVKDLLEEEGSFLSYANFCAKFGNVLNFVELMGLIKTIPKCWKDTLQTSPASESEYDSDSNVRDIVDTSKPKELQYDKLGLKITNIVYNYSVLNENKLVPIYEKWVTKMNNNGDTMVSFKAFVKCFKDLYSLTPSPKHRSFQFRLLHRRLFFNEILYKFKLVDSPRCSYCEIHYETLDHLMVECEITKTFWRKFQGWFECLTDTEITLSPCKILLNNFENIPYAAFLNTALLCAKQFIFVRKCLDKSINFYIFKDELKLIMKMERDKALQTRKHKKFCKKWHLFLM